MNDAALLDSLHAALRNPDLAWYTEFHTTTFSPTPSGPNRNSSASWTT